MERWARQRSWRYWWWSRGGCRVSRTSTSVSQTGATTQEATPHPLPLPLLRLRNAQDSAPSAPTTTPEADRTPSRHEASPPSPAQAQGTDSSLRSGDWSTLNGRDPTLLTPPGCVREDEQATDPSSPSLPPSSSMQAQQATPDPVQRSPSSPSSLPPPLLLSSSKARPSRARKLQAPDSADGRSHFLQLTVSFPVPAPAPVLVRTKTETTPTSTSTRLLPLLPLPLPILEADQAVRYNSPNYSVSSHPLPLLLPLLPP